MRTPRRGLDAAPVSTLALLTLAACSGGDEGVDPSTADWPAAIDPATADGEFFVVWTRVSDSDQDPVLAAEVDRLAEEGYDVEPWSPECQSGAKERLSELTGFPEPAAVGVAFATAEDAGIFDTRDEGATVSLTEGSWTC